MGMANALYSGVGNPWRFTVQTDRSGGNYHDGDYMTLRIYSEADRAVPLSNQLLVRGIVVEQEDTRTDLRPVATAKFTYKIGP
jgi:hypothetical protein